MNANEECGFKAIYISPELPEDNILNFPKSHSKFFFPRKIVIDI